MRAPLLPLLASAALAVAAAACFDWDGLLSRCQTAGNCLPDSGGVGDAGDAGDGGDAGDAGDGGLDAGDGGTRSRGQPCGVPQDCTSGACSPGGYCICVPGGPCRGDQDCCLGQTCSLAIPVGTCGNDVLVACSGANAGCGAPPAMCCSTCNPGSMMCDCSPNGARCNVKADCCVGTAQCSPNGFCCQPPAMGCGSDDQCCSRVCHNNACQ